MFHEARGSKRKAKRELSHLTIHAADGATADKPAWVVVHEFQSPDGGHGGLFSKEHKPKSYQFDSHSKMMQHLHDQTHPDVNVEEEGEE